MKKLLLSSVALCGLTFAAPAMADDTYQAGGVKLSLGGFYKGYLTYTDQDTAPLTEERNLDWLQDTEIHIGGETTLDNGLTIGAHFEIEADTDESSSVEESYAYASGQWGRVNAGGENGAVYLLQVAAPSADSNLDGIRQFVNPVNYGLTNYAAAIDGITVGETVGAGAGAFIATDTALAFEGFDYDDDVSAYANKVTYLTPVFSGFQAGFSFTPDLDGGNRDLEGVNADDVVDSYGNVYEIALRYAGEFDGFGVAVGGGFTHAELEDSSAVGFIDNDASGTLTAGDVTINNDDRQSWNVGLDLDISAFGIGAAYVQDDQGVDDDADTTTIVVGGDYTNGPWKLGLSYYNQEQELFGVDELDTDRYTGGVVYTYGPGMTFRGSISYIDHETSTLGDTDATSVLLGTQIQF